MSLLANQRPRSASEIIDASAQFSRAHAVPLLAIAAIVIIPPAVVNIFVSPTVGVLVNFLGNLLFSVGGAAASLFVIAEMTEGEISVGEAFRRSYGRIGSVIGAQILFGLAVIAGTVLLVLPGLFLLFRLILATTVAAVETTDSSRSISRSWALTKGHSMHVFKTMALGIGVSLLVLLGGGLLLGMLSEAAGLDESLADLVITPILMVVASFVWVVITLLYLDVRIRVEGADIEAMVAELPQAPAGAPIA